MKTMTKNNANKLSFKDKLDIAEAIFTIIVSIMAIWGTLIAWENGFWHKIESITNHVHQEYVESDALKAKLPNSKILKEQLKKIEDKTTHDVKKYI